MVTKKNGTTSDETTETESDLPEQANIEEITDEAVESADEDSPAEASGDDTPSDSADANETGDETPPEASDSDETTAMADDEWAHEDDPIELKPDAEDSEPPVEEPAEDTAAEADDPSGTTMEEPEPVSYAAAQDPVQHEDAGHEHDAHEVVYEEESGPSFASRALIVLILLLAGAGLGIWAAPKIAPRLPAGMASVSNWLMPGATISQDHLDEMATQMSGDITALSAEVESLKSELGSLPGQEAIEGRIADQVNAAILESEARGSESLTAALSESETRVTGSLQAAIEDIAAPETRQQLTRLEGALDGQIAELEDLKTQLTGGFAASSESAEETVARIDVYRSELEGLRAELGSLTDNVSALGERIDTVASTADRSIASAESDLEAAKAAFSAALESSKEEFNAAISEAEAVVEETRAEAEAALDAAAVEADVALISAALATAQPFAEPVSRLQAGSVDVPAGLVDAAETGAPTLLMLRDSFSEAAHGAIRANITSEAQEGGVFSRAQAFVQAQVSNRSLTPQEGSDPNAILSRMEDSLRQDDLATALAEAELLPPEVVEAMQPWLGDAQGRAAADAGLAELEAGLSATN